MTTPERAIGDERLQRIGRALSIGGIERHIFLCAAPATPRCATAEEGAAAWVALKKELKAHGLADAPPAWRGRDLEAPPPPTPDGVGRVLRTKTDCLRICEQGPIAVVYPDGVWYRGVTDEVAGRIVAEHLVGGRPVAEHVFTIDRLDGGSPDRTGAES
jgi:(2Fe-2S) ferredoxin